MEDKKKKEEEERSTARSVGKFEGEARRAVVGRPARGRYLWMAGGAG